MKSKKLLRLISLMVGVIMVMSALPMTSALAAEWTALIPSKASSGATFRLGVVSDAHLGATQTSGNNLDKALSAFSALGDVDAVAMNGDMVYAPSASNVSTTKYVYNGAEVNLPAELYSKFKSVIAQNGEFTLAGTQSGDVFTADTTVGKPIIYSVGNHEFPENDRDTVRAAASKQLYTEQTGRNPNHIMNVGGYTFIMSAPQDFFNDFRDAEEFVETQILAAEAADTSNKPIFYLQHESVHGTVVGSDSTAVGNTDEFKAFLNQHPRVIVLGAHTHATENDPRSIWQDGFTAMSTSQLGGGSVSSNGAKYSMGSNNTGSQCLMIDLTENTSSTDVKVYKLNILTGEMIGEPYTFTIDGTTDTFKYNDNRYENPSIANFKSGSALTIENEARQGFKFSYNTGDVEITKGEDYLQDNFVHSYRVVVKNTDANVTVQNFKVFGDFFEAESSQLSSYSVTLPNQLDRGTNYEISVYALTPFTASVSVDKLVSEGVTPVKYSFKTSDELTAADEALIRTHKGVNVSQGKTVIAGNPNRTNAQNMVDGVFNQYISPASYTEGATVSLPNGETVASATSNANDWFIVDLGRRYDISEVKVWPRGDSSQNVVYMQNFAVEAANEVDAANWDLLGSVGTDAPADFTAVSFNGNGNSYRYVRLRKTAITYHIYSEIEVFADVTAQEVSRNRQAEVNIQSYSNMGASTTVDGIVTDSTKCWLVEGAPALPYNLVVDLEQDYPIGFIEMFGRYAVNAENYRNNWNIYGYTNEQGKPDAAKTDFSDGTLLWSVTQAYPQVTNSTNPEGLKAPIADSGKYRYIVFSKTKRELAAIGEIRAEVVLPEVAGASRESDTVINFSFTEKMDSQSLSQAGAVTLVSDSGTVYTPQSVTLTDATDWDGGYDATLTFSEALPQGRLSLCVDGNVKAQNGITLVRDSDVHISGKAIEIDKSYSETISNVNVAFNKPVYSGRADADGAKLTNGEFKEMLHMSQEGYPETAPDILLPSGDSLKGATGYGSDWYVVDLGVRYNVKKINLYPVGSNYGYIERWMQNVAIDASNSITFDEYTQLGKIGSDVAAAGVTDNSTPFVINLDGTEAYRYIRLRRTGANDYAYGELEVYADVTATEVSRGASVKIDEGYTNAFGSSATEGVTDGNTSNEYRGVLFEGVIGSVAPPYNVLVDLGAEYPVGLIQMWGRGNENGGFTGVEAYRSNWTVYGATAANAPTSAQDTVKSVSLLTVGSNEYPASGLKASIETGSYRYLTFSKTAQALGCIGEIKASVINPVAYSAVVNDDETITINFSDKMEATSLVEANFSIDGVTLSDPIVSTGWDGGYSVTFATDGEIINGSILTISEKVRTEKGIEMAADQTIILETDTFTLTQDGTEVSTLTADAKHEVTANIILAEDTDIMLFVAVKDADGRLVSCIPSEKVSAEANTAATVKVEGIIPASGEKVYIYLWENGTFKPVVASVVVE